MPSGAVEIRGLKDFRRAMNRAVPDVNAKVKVAHRKIGQLVASKAPAAAGSSPPSRGPRHGTGAARNLASSFRAAPVVGAARIVSTLPYAFGAEYGAKFKRQFPSWVGQNPGYVGSKAVEDNRALIEKEYADALLKAFEAHAYPE